MNLTFGDALEGAKAGRGIVRLGWHLEGMVVRLQRPDAKSKMTEPYLYIEIPQPTGKLRLPWVASQADMLADDWVTVT